MVLEVYTNWSMHDTPPKRALPYREASFGPRRLACPPSFTKVGRRFPRAGLTAARGRKPMHPETPPMEL